VKVANLFHADIRSWINGVVPGILLVLEDGDALSSEVLVEVVVDDSQFANNCGSRRKLVQVVSAELSRHFSQPSSVVNFRQHEAKQKESRVYANGWFYSVWDSHFLFQTEVFGVGLHRVHWVQLKVFLVEDASNRGHTGFFVRFTHHSRCVC
jgi:hypothetical protein